jgi:hypothetical protein
MKTSKQQAKAFRNAIHAEKAREAYILAKRGGEFDHLAFDDWDDDRGIVDLSARAPVPSANGWKGLGA